MILQDCELPRRDTASQVHDERKYFLLSAMMRVFTSILISDRDDPGSNVWQ